MRKFTFNVYCDIDYSEHPEKVDVSLTQEDINRIKTAHSILENNEFDTVELSLGDIEYYDIDEGSRITEEENDFWTVRGERIKIRKHGWSVIGYDKWSGWVYWTDELPLHIL